LWRSKIQLPQKQIHLLFGSAIHASVEKIYDKEEPYSIFNEIFIKSKLLDDEKEKIKKRRSKLMPRLRFASFYIKLLE